jgi:hypothetical protein
LLPITAHRPHVLPHVLAIGPDISIVLVEFPPIIAQIPAVVTNVTPVLRDVTPIIPEILTSHVILSRRRSLLGKDRPVVKHQRRQREQHHLPVGHDIPFQLK